MGGKSDMKLRNDIFLKKLKKILEKGKIEEKLFFPIIFYFCQKQTLLVKVNVLFVLPQRTLALKRCDPGKLTQTTHWRLAQVHQVRGLESVVHLDILRQVQREMIFDDGNIINFPQNKANKTLKKFRFPTYITSGGEKLMFKIEGRRKYFSRTYTPLGRYSVILCPRFEQD